MRTSKNKFLCIGLLSLALVFGMLLMGCNTDGELSAATPKLKSLSISGVDATLGTPNEKAAQAVKGSVTLISKEIDANDVPVVKNPTITVYRETSETVKFAVTDTETPPAAESYVTSTPVSLKRGQYLWIEASIGTSYMYYKIEVTVAYSLFEIKNDPASREFTLTGWNSADASVKALTVVMVGGGLNYQYQWYSNTTLSNNGGTAIPGETNASYTPNITAEGKTYYYVVITNTEEEGGTLTSKPAVISIVASIADAPTEFTIGTTKLNWIRGVGGTGAFMFRQGNNADASPDADVTYIDKLCGEIGVNVLRIMVQDTYLDYIQNTVQSRNRDTFFHDAQNNFFAVIQRVNYYGGYVFANPWTAPAELKTNNTPQGNTGGGGRLRTDKYIAYADYFRGFLKWLNENNAPIFCLGILNEPDYGESAAYEGMGMTGQVTRDWFNLVGHFTTQYVANEASAEVGTQQFVDDIIPGWGGGGPTHHVLVMPGDTAGNPDGYLSPQIADRTGANAANNRFEVVGRHYYGGTTRYSPFAGTITTAWEDRPQVDYVGPYEAESLAMSPQMYAPGSTPRNIKREIWQTEHDFNHGSSTSPNNTVRSWNAAFAAANEIDYTFRVVGESVHDWWYSQSFSGYVTSNHTIGWPQPYTITPRGRAAAHYARYANETWLLDITQTKNTNNITFNNTNYDPGSTVPKISAFEDKDGKFISVVMFTPPTSTNNGSISSGFGQGGNNGSDDPTRGSTNVGKIKVVLPNGFVAASATAIRSYGNDNSTGQTYDVGVPTGSPRYWIDEPVFLSADGKSAEVTLPGGNLISIKFMKK